MTDITQPNPLPPPTPSSALAAPPSDPPRPLGPRGSRRAWFESRVRVWWASALLLAGIGAYFVVNEVRNSSIDRRIIRAGYKVNAKVTAINGSSRVDRVAGPAERAMFSMAFEIPGPASQTVEIKEVRLDEQRDSLRVNSTVVLYVDRNNPRIWTARQDATLHEDLLLGLIILPFANILLIVAVIQRIRILRTWRVGQVLAAVVVEVRQAPTAPLSRLVRFALRDGRDKRIFRAIVPASLARFQPGDFLWVVAPPGRPQDAIVAALFQ